MKNLVYLSPVPWTSFAQRPHKFVSWFHQRYGGRVLWVEPYATRFPTMSDWRRVRRIRSHGLVGTIPDWLTVLQPASLPIEPLPGSGWVNSHLWRAVLAEVINFARRDECVLAIGKPSVLAIQVMKALSQCLSIYDAMDDFPAFYSGHSRRAMKQREKRVIELADNVWASSTLLYERWRSEHTNVQLVRNGLDIAATSSVDLVTSDSDKTIFGYLGTIGNWFDWNLIMALAQMLPNDLIRIVGPVYKPAPELLPKNIEMLPPCNHAQAVAHMAQFDIGLIPFMKNELTDSVDPIKYYEYRALGLPVLSSDFGEMHYRDKEDGVFLVRDIADLSNVVKLARSAMGTRRMNTNFIEANSWTARFDETGGLF